MNSLLFYLIQLIIGSGILYGYYHLVLRNKKFHLYNRYYLLAAVVLSIVVPFLNIPVYFTDAAETPSVILQTLLTISPYRSDQQAVVSSTVVSHESVFTVENILKACYLLVATFILIRLLTAIFKIKKLFEKYVAERIDHIYFINTAEPGTPFSFFKWLFWNNKIEMNSEEGQQIFRHELFHIEQKHSWDIIFMEMISVVFWINPFFYLVKKEIKTIHEFLADEFATNENDKWNYAELLLMQVLNTHSHRLINPFFHNQIKRRIAMITLSKKPSYQYLRKIMVLPVAVIVIALFAFTYKQRINLETQVTGIQDTTQLPSGKIKAKWIFPAPKPLPKITPTKDMLKSWQNAKIYGVWIDEKRVSNEQLKNFSPTDFSNYFVSKLSKNATNYGKHYYQVNLMTNDYYYQYLKSQDPNKEFTGTRIIDRDTLQSFLENLKNKMVIVNGKIKDISTLKNIDINDITSIILLEGKPALKKYGEKGKNGAIEITTKGYKEKDIPGDQTKSSNGTLMKEEKNGEVIYGHSYAPSGIRLANEDTSKPFDGALVVINGKERPDIKSTSGLKEINPNEISSINILKDSSAIIKYGEKGKNGAIEIFTKSHPTEKAITIVDSTVNGERRTTKIIEPNRNVSSNDNQKTHIVFDGVELGPSFPGGNAAWRKFLERTVNSDAPASNGAPDGIYTVWIKFIVETNGEIKEINPLTNFGYGMEDEVVRTMKLSPKWVPATQNGHIVRAFQQQPITFVVNDGKKNFNLPDSKPAGSSLGEVVVVGYKTKKDIPGQDEIDAIQKLISTKEAEKLSTLYPNPANNSITISFNSTLDGEGEVRIYDVNSRLQLTSKASLTKGINNLRVKVDNLTKGAYFVIVTDVNKKSSEFYKLVKQ